MKYGTSISVTNQIAINNGLYFSHSGRTDFLEYATGSGVVPPLGLKKVNIVLANTGDTVHASTCINTITIPNFYEVGYDTFKAVMDSIIGSQDFTSM